jgi:hypothetical protein
MRRRIFRIGLLIGSMLLASALIAGIAVIVLGIIHQGDSALAAPQSVMPMREAMDRVRAFAEDPKLDLSGGLSPAIPGDDSRPVYWFESGAGTTVDEFKVDGLTGEVLEATFRSRLIRTTPDRRTTMEQAAVIASGFAGRRFDGFSKLTLIERSSLPAQDVGAIHSIKWVLVDESTRAELPTSVTVGVTGTDGRVVRYIAQRDLLKIDTKPTISADQASSAALSEVAADRDWRSATVSSRRLQVIYDEVDHQRLAWAVALDAPNTTPTPMRLLIFVDARSGEIIELN